MTKEQGLVFVTERGLHIPTEMGTWHFSTLRQHNSVVSIKFQYRQFPLNLESARIISNFFLKY